MTSDGISHASLRTSITTDRSQHAPGRTLNGGWLDRRDKKSRTIPYETKLHSRARHRLRTWRAARPANPEIAESLSDMHARTQTGWPLPA
jgi:hypothetical protein